MTLASSTFSLGGTTFAGRELNEVEFGSELEFNDAGEGKASRYFAIKYDDAKSFRNQAIGQVLAVGQTIQRTDAARHPDFRELIATSVLFTPMLPPQGDDGDNYNWLKAQVVYATTRQDQGEQTTPDPGEDQTASETVRWSESWSISVEVVPTEIKTGGSYTVTTPVYFPIAQVEVKGKRVPSFDPTLVMALAGKINSGGLRMPSGISVPTLTALFAGASATYSPQEVEEGVLLQLWEVAYRFLVRPQSWNLGPGRDGAVPFDKALTWPGTDNPLYDASALLQRLISDPLRLS